MKRLIKRLVLHRNTIRALGEIERAEVHAGEVGLCTVWTYFASSCVGSPENPKPPPTK